MLSNPRLVLERLCLERGERAEAERVLHGLNPQEAIQAPRWLLGRTWGQHSDSLKLEGGFPQATIDGLRALGHEVELRAALDDTFGHAGCLIRDPNGSLAGGYDPRSDGAVAAF